MYLTDELVEPWLDAPPPLGPESEPERASWRTRFGDPALRPPTFVALVDGRIRGITWLNGRGSVRVGLAPPRSPDGVVDEPVAGLVDEAIAHARDAGIGEVRLRLLVSLGSEPLLRAIARTGGIAGAGRIEYRGPIDALPDEAGSPLVWRPVVERDAAAALYAETSRGSEDGLLPGEDPGAIVDAWLSSRFAGAPAETLHVGALDGRDAALVCAHVDPDDGWASLPFMGLTPPARGKGLGAAVHRHGIAMLRARGGRTYHDGTGLDNLPMRACFERLGVPELRRFHTFRWTLESAGSQR